MAILSRICFLCLALLSAAFVRPAHAAEELQLVEQKIKAGLLYNFLKYMEWPMERDPGAPTVVCLYGGDPFDGNLQPMAGRTVNQHAIQIRTVGSVVDMGVCAMVVINAATRANWPGLRDALAAKPILTVSDFDGFTATGGMIEFTHIANRIGVKINVDALAAAHLSVDDALLRLATVVRAGAER